MRQLIIFTNDELKQLLIVGNEIDHKMQDGTVVTFMSENTYSRNYRNNKKS